MTNSDIPAGHKVALKDIGAGEDIIKRRKQNRSGKGRYKGGRPCTYPQYKDGSGRFVGVQVCSEDKRD